jgi:hypothetical protein
MMLPVVQLVPQVGTTIRIWVAAGPLHAELVIVTSATSEHEHGLSGQRAQAPTSQSGYGADVPQPFTCTGGKAGGSHEVQGGARDEDREEEGEERPAEDTAPNVFGEVPSVPDWSVLRGRIVENSAAGVVRAGEEGIAAAEAVGGKTAQVAGDATEALAVVRRGRVVGNSAANEARAGESGIAAAEAVRGETAEVAGVAAKAQAVVDTVQPGPGIDDGIVVTGPGESAVKLYADSDMDEFEAMFWPDSGPSNKEEQEFAPVPSFPGWGAEAEAVSKPSQCEVVNEQVVHQQLDDARWASLRLQNAACLTSSSRPQVRPPKCKPALQAEVVKELAVNAAAALKAEVVASIMPGSCPRWAMPLSDSDGEKDSRLEGDGQDLEHRPYTGDSEEEAFALGRPDSYCELPSKAKKKKARKPVKKEVVTQALAKKPGLAGFSIKMISEGTFLIENMPAEVEDHKLAALFRQFPGFQQVRAATKPNAAFVVYESEVQACAAMGTLQNLQAALCKQAQEVESGWRGMAAPIHPTGRE